MKKNKKTAVFSVIFPNAERFLDDYLISLEKQTYKDFDLIVINDGVASFSDIAIRHNLNIMEIPLSAGAARNREFGINYIKKAGYDYLIFCDSDDMYASDRLEKVIGLLARYDIVVNDLAVIDENGKMFRRHYIADRADSNSVITLDDILDKNMCGFSNTAIHLDCIAKYMRFDRHLTAVDWYFFTLLLKKGCRAVFTREALSFYRQYQGNIAGAAPKMTKERISRDLDIKLAHYKTLTGEGSEFEYLYERFKELREKMKSAAYAARYISRLKKANIKNLLWWEHIRLPEELGL